MNKRVDFSNIGGFPLTQNTLDFMQASYRGALSGIAGLLGEKVIANGVAVQGNQISDGWIVYGGELIPFVGGAYSDQVIIQEVSASATFQDNNVRPVYYTKQAIPGQPGNFPFSDLKRLSRIQDVWVRGDIKHVDCTTDYIANNFLPDGTGINERFGWAICNGNNGTKDRRGRLSIAWDDRVNDPGNGIWDVLYNTIGGTTGQRKHTILQSELPAVLNLIFKNAPIFAKSGTANTITGVSQGDRDPDPITNSRDTQMNFSNQGGGQAISLIPPVIVTLVIQKL